MKKLLVIAAIALATAITGAPRLFAQSASFTYSGVPTGALAPGATFTIQVSLVFTAGGSIMNLNGLSYWMAQQSPTSGFAFSITNRNASGSLFTDLQSPGLTYPQVMDPINRNQNGTQTSTDLGALSQTGQPNGTYFIAALTFQIASNAAPGTYTIRNTTSTTPGVGGRISVINDSNGNTFAIAASPFNITIVPEPSTFALLGFGALAGVVAYRRRKG